MSNIKTTTQKLKLKIQGMHCSSCAMVIDMDLEEAPGVRSTKTNYAKSETEVEFDPEETTAENILKTIQKSGYQASPLDT